MCNLETRGFYLCPLELACPTPRVLIESLARMHGPQLWKAPRGAGERDLLGIRGGIGRFNDHQTIAATPHRSPVLWDMFAHRFPALVS